MQRLQVGGEFGGYRIQRLIGRGGMSVLYQAENPRLSRTVALKILAPELAEDDEFRERFVRESKLAASLDHPHIVDIYDAGDEGGLLYIAMRYVKGDLKSLLEREGPLPLARVVPLIDQIASALDAAHDLNLVHRDVKPANILIAFKSDPDEEGHVYLADFGLMKDTTARRGMTGTGQVVGTLDYISPEQIRGNPVDARTDVYALACVLYECLTGRVPFERNSDTAVMWAHLKEEPPRASDHFPNVSTLVADVIDRGLSKAPEDRYPNCMALAADLRAALGAKTDTGKPAPLSAETVAVKRVEPPRREHRAPQDFTPQRRPPERAPERPPERAPERPPRERAEPEHRAPRHVSSERPPAPVIPDFNFEMPPQQLPSESLEAGLPPREADESRAPKWKMAAVVIGSALGALSILAIYTFLGARAPAPDSNPANASRGAGARPDLELVFASDASGVSHIYSCVLSSKRACSSSAGEFVVQLTAGSVPDEDPVWSPTGKIAFVRGLPPAEIYVMKDDGSNVKQITSSEDDNADPAWSPDGSSIAFTRGVPGDIYVMDADGRGATRLTDHPADDQDAAWAPEGTKIAFVSRRDGVPEIYVMKSTGKREERITEDSATEVRHPTWSPSGNKIAFTSDRDGNLEIYVMKPDGTGLIRLTETPALDEVGPSWSPDGKKIAFVRISGAKRNLFILKANGSGKPRKLRSGLKGSFDPAWLPTER
jgi:serine/threonine protein kinase